MSIPGSLIPLFNTGGGGVPGQISRSLRFNAPDSAYLNRTPASAGNRKTWTWAAWVKRSGLDSGTQYSLFGNNGNSNDTFGIIAFFGNNIIVGGWTINYLVTSAVYRDPSSWMHIVVAMDTTQATASNRLKLYVNGSEVTAFSTDNRSSISQNSDQGINQAVSHAIGRQDTGSGSSYFSGFLADVFFIDGQALTPSSFAETDATTGQWVPKAFSGGSYGTNGFRLTFSDNSTAAALGTDTSGNGNTWTVNNLYTSSVTSLPGVFFGSGNLLTAPSSADFNFGTGDFTVEYFLNRTSLGSNDAAITNYSQVATGYFMCLHSNTTDAYLFLNGSSVASGGTAEANKWIHYAFVRSGTTCTIYKNGVSIASGTSSAQAGATNVMNIGAYSDGTSFIKGAISNVRIVKGTAVYTSNFTPPSAPLSNITNTVLLCCQSSSSATTAAVSPGAITATGAPTAGTYNDSSPNQDSLVDTPTSGSQVDTGLGGQVTGNYCTWNPLDNGGSVTLSNGNLDITTPSSGLPSTRGTLAVSSGKWFYEFTVSSGAASIGFLKTTDSVSGFVGSTSGGYAYYSEGASYTKKINNNIQTDYGASFVAGDVIGVALDLDAGTITFYKNGASQGQAFSGLSGTFAPAVSDGTNVAGISGSANFGQRPFAYPVSGFKALCDTNLPAPVVAKPSTVMDVKLYTGNGSTQTVSGLGFSPDLVWIKGRSTSSAHNLYDSIRGRAALFSNATNAELALAAGKDFDTFTSDGFTLLTPQDTAINNSGVTFAAWTWDAGTSTVTNTQGSITGGSQVRANPSSGFSVVTWTGQSTAASIGHGLNAAPSLIICKARSNPQSWGVYHKDVGINNYLLLDSTDASTAFSGIWGSSAPTSTVFSVPGNVGLNNFNGWTYAAYCFAPVASYSAMGSYTGNGSADGPFVYTGHRSRWLMVKASSSAGNWVIFDTARNTYNVVGNLLLADASDSEYSVANLVDICSNGFKMRDTHSTRNASGVTYVWASFAEFPFQYARAR